mgnify:CR=1 FL=1
MSQFTEGRFFIAFMSVLTSPQLFLFGVVDPDTPWPMAAVGAIGCAYVAVVIWLWRTDNHGRGGLLRSRVRRRLAPVLVGPIKACGCWDSVKSDTVESEPYVRRSMDGAQIRLEARKREMRRCHSCGRHYHTTTSGRTSDIGSASTLKSMDTSGSIGFHRETVIWPEDEPDAIDAIDVPIERD